MMSLAIFFAVSFVTRQYCSPCLIHELIHELELDWTATASADILCFSEKIVI